MGKGDKARNDQDSLGYNLPEEVKYCDELYDCTSDSNSLKESLSCEVTEKE